ncbi:MAG: hypothetical protein U5Q03_01670 [Bacteroidota bacterium]|nr:hypothetical protein [Bacteroidota bacterium]
MIGNEDVYCTEEFAMVSVEIVFGNTPQLDFETYTLRLSTGDTIRYDDNEFSPFKVVLADDCLQILQGKQEDFIFMSQHKNTLLFQEQFVIGADRGHVYKYSGIREIML